LPPSFRFPPLREGNRARRAYSVPPACRGNLKEGVINCCFCELWLGDWYNKGTSAFALTPSPSPTGQARGVGVHGGAPAARSPSPARRARGFRSAEAKLPPALKLTLQHSKGLARGWG